MNERMIVTLNVEELRAIICEGVTEALQKAPHPQSQEDVLLKKKEVATLFQVSLVTINQWMKEGRIPYHRINSRVFFKKHEMLEALSSSVPVKRYGRFKN